MKKATLIATCLINSGFGRRLNEVEASVRNTFETDFPHLRCDTWNSHIDDKVAESMIRAVGRASMINVTNFIKDLM